MREVNRRLMVEAFSELERYTRAHDAGGMLNAYATITGLCRAILDDPNEKPHWSETPANVADLIEWLDEHDRLPDEPVDGIMEILEKPWHWDVEYAQMRGETVMDRAPVVVPIRRER